MAENAEEGGSWPVEDRVCVGGDEGKEETEEEECCEPEWSGAKAGLAHVY